MHYRFSTRIARIQSLIYSVYDGFFFSLMVGFGETYLSAYAIFLGADNFQLGILSSLPPFLAGISQFSTIPLMKKVPSRRKFVSLGAMIQALSFIPLYFTYKLTNLRIEVYIALVTFYFVSSSVTGPAWNSWMGDLVKASERSVYFSRRNRVITIGTFTSMLFAGFILRYFKVQGLETKGFGLILLLAFITRGISAVLLTQKYDPPCQENSHSQSEFLVFFKTLNRKNEGILVLYMSAVNFAVYTAAAYFTPYMLKELHFEYTTFTLIISGGALTKFLTFSLWGRICDHHTPKKMIAVCGVLVSFTTIPWLLTGNPWILFLAQCYTGFVWAGYDLSTFTFLLDATEPSERAKVTSYLNIVSSTAGLLGGITGAVLFSFSNIGRISYFAVFILSAALRVVAVLAFGQRLSEVRIISPVSARDILLKFSGFRSAMGMTTRVVVYARARTRYPKTVRSASRVVRTARRNRKFRSNSFVPIGENPSQIPSHKKVVSELSQ